MKKRNYIEGTHFYGRIATVLAMLVMFSIPTIICSVYDIWPTFMGVLSTAGPLLALFIPSALSEVISFTPITGTAGYIASITGNVSNIKFPCAINAMESTNAVSGTEKGEVMAMSAMCVSGMVTTIIIAMGVLLLVPLQPILTSPVVVTATKYIMPALFGSMAISVFINKNIGEYEVKGKMKIAIVPMVIILLVQLFVVDLARYQGYVLLATIPFTVFIARVMYKKGIVTMKERSAMAHTPNEAPKQEG
ncbi:MAG: hypothetical protein RSA20_09570 [Oscillospiraceae bacterium]